MKLAALRAVESRIWSGLASQHDDGANMTTGPA